VTITGGVFDLFALAVALVLEKEEEKEEDVNVAILGLGAGTCARLIDDLYHSSKKRVKMYGYELDDVIVDLGMKHFGMNDLKEKGSLVDVRVGDALENIKAKKSDDDDDDDDVKFDLIIVDLFDDQSRVIPQLLEVERWEDIAKRLRNPPSSSSSSSDANVSRVICNLSTGRGRGANINNAVHVAELIAETCGSGDISIWPSSKMNVWNECCISGPKPSFGVDTTPKALATYCPHWITTSKYKKSSKGESDDDDDDEVPMNGWLLDRLFGTLYIIIITFAHSAFSSASGSRLLQETTLSILVFSNTTLSNFLARTCLACAPSARILIFSPRLCYPRRRQKKQLVS
jgi:hypothetical protein